MIFWPKMGVLWGKTGEGVVRCWPLTNSFFLLRRCQFWWRLIKKCDRESARRRTDTLTDANRFYSLSHAICYSYGTDKSLDYNVVMTFRFNNNKKDIKFESWKTTLVASLIRCVIMRVHHKAWCRYRRLIHLCDVIYRRYYVMLRHRF